MPEMRGGTGGQGNPVTITVGAALCPADLADIAVGVQSGPHDFWMDVPRVARVHVADGTTITIDPVSEAAIGDIKAYLLGSAMGALLQQRELLPLHASAVLIGDSAVAFCGASGAGKSTLALAMVRRGHQLLSDDICTIDTLGNGAETWPGLVNLKLWRESLEGAGEGVAALEAVLPSLDKYKLPVARLAPYRPVALSAIFLLSDKQESDARIWRPSPSAAVAALVANTFRGQLVAPMGRARAHFDQCIAVQQRVRVATLARPRSLQRMDEVCAVVEAAVRTL